MEVTCFFIILRMEVACFSVSFVWKRDRIRMLHENAAVQEAAAEILARMIQQVSIFPCTYYLYGSDSTNIIIRMEVTEQKLYHPVIASGSRLLTLALCLRLVRSRRFCETEVERRVLERWDVSLRTVARSDALAREREFLARMI